MARSVVFGLLILILSGCAYETTPVSPEEVYMAKHITLVHGIRVDGSDNADIVVTPEEEQVSLIFTPALFRRLQRDASFVLRIEEGERVMARREYLNFLDKLHAYLMITPLALVEPEEPRAHRKSKIDKET